MIQDVEDELERMAEEHERKTKKKEETTLQLRVRRQELDRFQQDFQKRENEVQVRLLDN